MQIDDESIKYFIELIQEEKIKIPIERYNDIYKLSEYFCIPTITSELDNIGQEYLYKDLNFTLQILQDYERLNNNYESKMMIKIENFLKTHINECIQNNKFGELQISIIYRLIDESKENIDHNLLFDFILKSTNTRFIIFKLIKIDQMSENKISELLKFLETQEETTKNIYLEYIPFNLSFIQNIISKYEEILKSMKETEQELNETKQTFNQTKQEFNQTKQEFNQTKQEFNQTKQEFNQTKQELNQTKQEFNQTKQELSQTKQELNQTKKDLNQTKQELNQTQRELNETKQELNQTKQELNQTKQDLNQTKQNLNQTKQELNQAKNVHDHIKNERKQFTQSISVAGYDKSNELGEKPNNKNKSGTPIIDPPMKLSLDPSSILSFSAYYEHSVVVTKEGSLKGIGNNNNCKISCTLEKTTIDKFTDFYMKDSNGHQLSAISAVCYEYGTLYILSKSSGNGKHLVLCDCQINSCHPVFLDVGNHHPMSLFGGCHHLASIGREGDIIFINRNSVKNSLKSRITAVSLPNDEKATSVACCESSIVVLSSSGRVFSSKIESNGVLNFSSVSELSNHEIISVSGTYEHFIAVSKEGRVFGCGSNKNGKLGLGEGTKSVSAFTEILSLSKYEIRAAYAGYSHSLFETHEGKILSCGYNYNGELLLSSGAGEDVYSPTETTITRGASFCIVGNAISVVFIGNSPPPNTPNTQIHQYD